MAVSVFQLNQGQDSQFTLHTHLLLNLDWKTKWNIILCFLAMERKEDLPKSSDYEEHNREAFPHTWHYMRKKGFEPPWCFIIVGREAECVLISDSVKVKDCIHEINRRRSVSFERFMSAVSTHGSAEGLMQ